MDLSQQELPLTAYFTRGSKEARSRAVSHKKNEPTDDSQSVARSSKRKRTNVQCSTASPLSSSVGRSKLGPNALQLPTPAASARKRVRGEVKQNATLSCSKDLAQLEFGPTSSKLPQSSRKGAEDANPELPSTPLAMPSTDRRKTTKHIDVESLPAPRLSNHTMIGIATPRTSSRGVAEPVRGIDDCSPLARSNSHLPSKSDQVSPGVSHAVLPHVQLLARSTAALPCSPVDLGHSDPFRAREQNSVFVPRDGVSAPSKQHFIRSETLDGQSSDGHVIPMMPVPSSQSQYLLHLDATPKRKRCSRHIEHVISSQTQEERELTLSMSHKPAAMASLSVRVSPGKCTPRGNTQIHRPSCSKRKSRHVYTPGSTPVGSPIDSSTGPSRSLSATKKASDELLSKSLSPLRRKRLASFHSPGCKTKTPRGPGRHDSIENIPLAHIEDSLTEPESDSDILQVPCHSPGFRNACPPVRCGFAQGCLEDDSATEAESDTEILHFVAGIGKKQPCERTSEVSREDAPPPPVISPLVSPARPRIAAMPSIVGFTQITMQEGAGLSVPGSCTSYPSMEQLQTCSESLPSVVRDFIRMFPGD
ncbi:hypothetical protein J3R82DRAFT_4500 [Butyriboletus roseoflavus]|nr:hypothetical protein J3R82DRAFT_4500 [Butyriboletus roseoflavus]